jgi:hypothetical protein
LLCILLFLAIALPFLRGFARKEFDMCPLRVILIFLSATIAGFFLIRGVNAEPDQFQEDDGDDSGSPRAPAPLHSKVSPSPPSPMALYS